MKEHTGHNPGYIDDCDYGFLMRERTGEGHPRHECYSPPSYVVKTSAGGAFACLDHLRSVTHMLLQRVGVDAVTTSFYRNKEGS